MTTDNKVWFEKINNKNVFCCMSEVGIEQKKLVIMSHGFRSSSIGPARTFVDFERILNKNGFSVLRFDQPNSGNSEGDYIDSSFDEWTKTIVYLVNKYILKGYAVYLLGQSMGATATLAAAEDTLLKGKIEKIILWVPGLERSKEERVGIMEEAGQLCNFKFWNEARKFDFFDRLKRYDGKIHLVYGENDKYVDKELREKVIEIARTRNDKVMILSRQGHSPWEYEVSQKVFEEELEFLSE